MPIRRILKSLPLLLAASACLVGSADEAALPWSNKPIEQWTQEDARQVLADSPWVKSVQLQIVRDLSPDERRASGNMSADVGKGVGLAGLAGILGSSRGDEAIARAHAKPDPGKVVVRWESARPVRSAEMTLNDKDAPALDSDYYAVVVYNVPTPKRWNLAKELQGVAALKRDKKKDLKPSRVVILRKEDGRANVVYLFRRSVEITKKDAYVVFSAQIERLVLWQPFYPQQMQIQGELEL
jgi:hypothetical protein